MGKYKTPEELLKILETAKDKNGQIPMNLVRQAFSKLPPALPVHGHLIDKGMYGEIYMAQNGLVNDKPSNSKDVVNESDVINGKYGHKCIDPQETLKLEVMELPPAPHATDRWNRLMMYLADLQLAYAPVYGHGDEKLHQFVTGLIEELEGWMDAPPAQPQSEIACEENKQQAIKASNTIRRSDAIDALIKAYTYIDPMSFTDVIMGVEDAPAQPQLLSCNKLQDSHQWIPCSERLPEDYKDVLCWYEYFRYGNYNRLYQTYGVGYYNSNYDCWGGDVSGHKVRAIAWQPLPEPYREEQKKSD